MRTPEVMRKSKLIRLEYIALGFAMAKNGDRAKVLDELDPDSLFSPLVAKCLQAVATRDEESLQAMREVFRQWGVSGEGPIIDLLLEEVNIRNSNRMLRESLRKIDTTSEAELDEAADYIASKLNERNSVTGRYRMKRNGSKQSA